MRKWMAIFVVVFLMISSMCAFAETSTANATTEYDFKSFRWGDSNDTIIAVEGTPIYEDKLSNIDAEYILYKTTTVGLDMFLGYYFCDDGLYQIRYLLNEEHSNESLYIDDYKTFRNALTKKYGDPLIDGENWENDSKKEYYANRKGDALSYGYLSYLTMYLTDRTIISMEMSADNYDVTMKVVYLSIDIDPGEADYSDEI